MTWNPPNGSKCVYYREEVSLYGASTIGGFTVLGTVGKVFEPEFSKYCRKSLSKITNSSSA